LALVALWISCRWLAEHVIFSLTDDQPSLEYQTTTT
jgi:hypothetical protein